MAEVDFETDWPGPRPNLAEHPWQRFLSDIDLMVHAPLDLDVDIASLKAEFTALDADARPEARSLFNPDGSWSNLHLITRDPKTYRGLPLPELDRMPSVSALIASTGWTVLTCCFIRLPPGGTLPWHFEDQAPHLKESRLLIPVEAPRGAFTLVGGTAVAYPEGTAWTGDFSFPHQVENHSSRQRVALLVDAVNTPEVTDRLPEALRASPLRRRDLSFETRTMILRWRQEQMAEIA